VAEFKYIKIYRKDLLTKNDGDFYKMTLSLDLC